eukprot:TRINITY_DN3920_c0_g1_i1.p1 TRINITY_DN3920_c0_g1~~TRINITY_DN3920_c0_g1_i1.p1  ORF type:complete len:101 (-),score=2.68 TRINITY_DN3920_c0_g1_i1:698-1000(-)
MGLLAGRALPYGGRPRPDRARSVASAHPPPGQPPAGRYLPVGYPTGTENRLTELVEVAATDVRTPRSCHVVSVCLCQTPELMVSAHDASSVALVVPLARA